MSLSPYLTVPEAAKLLEMTPQGVRALIDKGRLRAIKRSERKTLVPRFAIDAFQARLNGGGPPSVDDEVLAPLSARLDDFQSRTGCDPAQWLGHWRTDPGRDTSEAMRVTIAALALLLETEQQGEKPALVTEPVEGPFALAAFTLFHAH